MPLIAKLNPAPISVRVSKAAAARTGHCGQTERGAGRFVNAQQPDFPPQGVGLLCLLRGAVLGSDYFFFLRVSGIMARRASAANPALHPPPLLAP